MINVMEIDGHRAVITYDPEIEMFRGEFTGLNGGADFYADSIEALHHEGRRSLRVFMETCAAQGIDPIKKYSGKFNLRLSTDMHARASEAAAAKGVSLNDLVVEALEHELEAA